jgi:hypothetical protein
MQREPVPRKSLAQDAENPFGIELILECHDGIVSEARVHLPAKLNGIAGGFIATLLGKEHVAPLSPLRLASTFPMQAHAFGRGGARHQLGDCGVISTGEQRQWHVEGGRQSLQLFA